MVEVVDKVKSTPPLDKSTQVAIFGPGDIAHRAINQINPFVAVAGECGLGMEAENTQCEGNSS